ncbi:Putative transcriptional regulator, ArsR family [Desulfonema magnum]|uniref:Transcriptional regulator, ArsR family n=1 Tax=Desulfonema magnum TaxID=45655 RepID=A0A975GPN5_9BACT|nr:Putative transcriptional regulator, ArsR family [Desulfonema magnum]
MQYRELFVCEIQAGLKLAQPSVSKQLNTGSIPDLLYSGKRAFG